jgi:uncharacterized protein
VADSSAEIAVRFLETLGRFDLDALMEMMAADAVQEIPFDRNEATKVLAGKANLQARYAYLFDVFESSTFTVDAVHPHADPEWVSVEYHGHIVANDGTVFENTYLAMFQVKDGLIHQFREFFAPVIPEEVLGS